MADSPYSNPPSELITSLDAGLQSTQAKEPGFTQLKFSTLATELNSITVSDINTILASKDSINLWKKHNAELREILKPGRTVTLIDNNNVPYEIKYQEAKNRPLNLKAITLLACASVVFIISAYLFAFTPHSLVGSLILITSITFTGYNLIESAYNNQEVTHYNLLWVYMLLALRNISYFSLLCIVAVYPRQCISLRTYFIVSTLIALFTFLDCFTNFPTVFSNLMVFIASVLFWYFLIKQWHHSKSNPVLYAQFKSLLLIIAMPCLLCLLLFSIPIYFFNVILLNQIIISVSFVGMWCCMVWMIYRRNLFNLESYWFRLWFWSLAAGLGILTQVSLTNLFQIDHITALLASLLIVSWIFIPLSKPIWQQVLRSRGQDIEVLLPDVISILLSNRTIHDKWLESLNVTFQPLEISGSEVSPRENFKIIEHGSSLLVKSPLDNSTVKLTGRNKGTRLFNNDDLALLSSLHRLVEQAIVQEQALEDSKTLERKKNMEQFAFLSHELRTPLTLIMGPLEDREGKSLEELNSDLTIAHRNAKKLFKLVNQMLDFTRFQASPEYQEETVNLTSTLTLLLASYRSLIASKQITLDAHLEEEIHCLGTVDYINHIMGNLLSNCVKYSPESSQINLSCFLADGVPTIELTDQGAGLSAEELKQIFQPFYRSQAASQSQIEGFGVGLAVVKSLIDKMGASIEATSSVNSGTSFRISLRKTSSRVEKSTLPSEPQFQNPNVNARRKDSPSILIVDDTHDMLTYLCNCIGNDYNVMSTDNAKNALEIMDEHAVDLVVSDVMMSPMNGYEFCKKIKSNPTTDHIPIILLTAKADMGSKLKGLSVGADEYLQKPFNRLELLSRISGLIETRSRLREKYSRQFAQAPVDSNSSSTDNNAHTEKSLQLNKEDWFLKQTQTIIEKNHHRPDFTPSDLASELAMSLRALQLKSKAILGSTPGQLIQTFRIKRAEQYLHESDLSINEISSLVGIENPAYFSRQFKSHTGISPSAFRTRAKNPNNTSEDQLPA